MTSHSSNHLVWFITGTSQGFGHELVRAVLQRGDSVVATSRNPQSVSAAFSKAADRLLAASMDLRDPAQISSVVANALARFGRLDILVNNAGYGVTGAVEEASEKEIAAVYETNVFGLLTGMPGWGIYNSTKFAVEGLSEALAAELAPLGIGVTIVEPGPFRTEFLGGSLVKAANSLPDYEATAGKTRASALERNGKQQGDPAAAANAIVQAVTSPNPPLHLLLGKFAYDRFHQKLDALRNEMETWRDVGLGTDFKS